MLFRSTLDQRLVESLAREPRLLLLCGRYEGFDERIRLGLAPLEISIGDYITNGGEVPAMVLIETLIRLVPGVLGDETSSRYESFAESGRLEYPQYTRPREYRGMSVPEVLLNGNHAEIASWREAASLERTRERRGGDPASPTASRTLSGLVPPPPGGPPEAAAGSRASNPG